MHVGQIPYGYFQNIFALAISCTQTYFLGVYVNNANLMCQMLSGLWYYTHLYVLDPKQNLAFQRETHIYSILI